ncbi:MAG: Oxidoreductase, zinc-binding dehydrogenase family [Caulobacteraceae bacterium]|nr:Oxidoreductase, zinc-binding dehydrogenase family [Caulobacteraceae bacterium]
MKAVVAQAFGPPETFRIEELPMPMPGAGEVRVDIHAASVSFVDALIAAGQYQVKPELPFIPGGEFAGVVGATGEGVTALKVGDRVCGAGLGGGFAQQVIRKEASLTRTPETMEFREAAVFQVSYATAYHALVQRGALQPGETVLVLGAAGAIGVAAIQIAKALGARVVASSSTEAKRAMTLAAGADAAVTAGAADWRDQVRAAAPKGVDIVVDPIGGDALEPAFRSLAWRGRHLVIGFVGGIAKLPTNLALVKGAALLGVDIRQFSLFEPQAAAANIAAIYRLHAEGRLTPVISATYPLEAFADAMAAVSTNAVAGRVVIDIA